MLLLSSGRSVDISTDRAKLHALHNRGPAPGAPHRALYKLVDIIYRKKDEAGTIHTGWTEYDFDYSGYTLADIYKVTDWSPQEKSELLNWVTLPSQMQCIETARRRLIEQQENLSIKYYTAPEFLYSRLRKILKTTPLNKASVKQWQATINNSTSLRKEEIEWSGLHALLSRTPEHTALTKQQLLDATCFNNTQISLSTEKIFGANGELNFREVAQRMPHQAVYRAALKLDEHCICILRYTDEINHYRVGVVKSTNNHHDISLNRRWFALDPYGRAITCADNSTLFFSDSETAKTAANLHAEKSLTKISGAMFHTRYDHLTLYGGDKYREWIISLPDFQRTFFGAHYFDHNVLVHVRTTSRTDDNNRKLLFIEEIQSDWHQNGKVHGYDNKYWGKVANAPFKKEWVSLAVKLMLIHASQNGFDGIGWPDGNIQETRYSNSLHAIKRHYDKEIPRTLNRLGNPFNTSVQRSHIKTRDPWLNLIRSDNKWRVSDGTGKFETKNKYKSREEAMMVLHCNCKTIQLEVSVFEINQQLRQQIAEQGLPLYGDCL